MAKNIKSYCTIGLGGGHREYNVCGVKYIVSAEFSKPEKDGGSVTLYDRMKSYMGSEFSDITAFAADTSAAGETVLPAAV